MALATRLHRIRGNKGRVMDMKGIRLVLLVVPILAATVLAPPLQAASPIVPVIAAPVSHPAKTPVAGKGFEVTFPVLNAVNGARLTNVTSLSFEATIAGKVVRLQQTSFVAGYRAVAGVVWMTMAVPGASEGQVLKLKVTIEAGGRTATRLETYRIGNAAV
jgi:hypothetical protein